MRQEVKSKDKVLELLLSDDVRKNRNTKNVNFETKPTVTNSEGVQEISGEDTKNSNGDYIINKKHDIQGGKKRSIVILGDSILKDIEQHKVRQRLENNEKAFLGCHD